MPDCEYVDQKRSGPNGWYCVITNGRVKETSLINNYCCDSIRCAHCPKRGGDDKWRRKESPEPERRKSDSISAEDLLAAHTIYGGGGSSGGSSGGYSGGYSGGSSGVGFFDGVGFFLKAGVVYIILFVVVAILVYSAYFLGIMDPWVDMQLPEGARTEGVTLYTVSQDVESQFEIREKAFEEDGKVHARVESGHNDVYYKQDEASVWLGTCHVTFFNTAVVYDITYDEIMQQLYRPLLVELKSTAGEPILSGLTVTDAAGQEQRCVDMGGGMYAVVLPDEVTAPELTFTAQGYESYTARMDLSARLTQAVVTLVEKGGAAG